MIFKFENKLFHPSLITCLKIKNLLFHLYKKSGAYCQYVYTINQIRNLLLLPANQVWGKIIFLHLFVILFTGGGGWVSQHALQQVSRGVCSGGVPDGDPPGTATAAGGTNPTGMHSCYKCKGISLAYFVCSTDFNTNTINKLLYDINLAKIPIKSRLKYLNIT